jgi:hypothetical protein
MVSGPSLVTAFLTERDCSLLSAKDRFSGDLIMHVHKVDHVTTIDRVAEKLGESVEWLYELANEMDTEDGVIWVYGLDNDAVMAFTDLESRTSSS